MPKPQLAYLAINPPISHEWILLHVYSRTRISISLVVGGGGGAGLKLKLYKKHNLKVRINQKHLTKINIYLCISCSDLEIHFKDYIDMALTLESITL